jgi:hypothetical protein
VTIRLILCCDGAAYFDDGTPDYGSFKCTKTLPAKAAEAYGDRGALIDLARDRGWRIGPKGDVMCPDCSKPDPRTLRLIDALGATPRGAS